jgi:hypothetical protein
MPHFTCQLPNLELLGPVVRISVLQSPPVLAILRETRQSPAKPEDVLALVDTGASASVVKQGIAERLGLQPVGVVQMTTPSCSGIRCYRYAVQLLFPNKVAVKCTVTEAPLKDQPIQLLIGRDILRFGVLVYIGHTNTFTLSF